MIFRLYICACMIWACSPFMVNSQSLYEDFSQGYPHGLAEWKGDTADYFVNGVQQLQLDRSGSGISSIWTDIELQGSMQWSLWLKLSFNTSVNNHARWILYRDSLNRGLDIRIGGANDSLNLLYHDNGADSLLCSGLHTHTGSSSTSKFLLARYEDSLLTLLSSNDSIQWITECSASIFIPGMSAICGLESKVTSSNSSKVRFDCFAWSRIYPDTTGPIILKWLMPYRDEIILLLNEGVDTNSTNPSDFQCEGQAANSIQYTADQDTIHLRYSLPLPDRQWLMLEIPVLCDTLQNCSPDSSFNCFYMKMEYADIQITEIMADPSPPMDLPETEYLELHNRTGFPVKLEDWKLRINDDTKLMPTVMMEPNSFHLVMKESELQAWPDSMSKIAMASVTLPNNGSTISLRDKNGQLIHAVRYESSDWGEGVKSDGGWSLERIDVSNNSEDKNWAISTDPSGGSPGRTNPLSATMADKLAPGFIRAVPLDLTTFNLCFDQQLDSSIVADPKLLTSHDGLDIESYSWISDYHDAISVHLEHGMQQGSLYSFEGVAAMDLNGNQGNHNWNALLGWPEWPDSADIIINEILFDVAENEFEFIEIYNRSQKLISLKYLALGEYDTSIAMPISMYPLSDDHRLLFPGDYIYLTRNTEAVAFRYGLRSSQTGARVENLFNLSDAGSTLCLLSMGGEVLDMTSYNKEMHHPAMMASESYSLERVSPELPATDVGSWQSASITGPGASPGFVNSCMQNPFSSDEDAVFSIHPTLISPDLDGYADQMLICWEGLEPGSVIDIDIYTLQGLCVYRLIEEIPAGSRDCIAYNGRDADGKMLPEGIYVLKMRHYSSGKWKSERKAFAIDYPGFK